MRVALLLASTTAFVPLSRPAVDTSFRAVWSDSRAVQDYQNLLEGKIPERKSDGKAVVVGDDPLAIGLANMAPGEPDPIFQYNQVAGLPPGDYPVYVSLSKPEALEALLSEIPENKREDLVFINYGDMIENILKKFGLLRDATTQAVAYYSINEFGNIEDDRTSLGDDRMGLPKYAAETSVTGKWAGAYADRLRRNNLHCSENFYRDFRRKMLERVVYESVFNLVAILHKRCPLSEVPDYFRGECNDMLYEFGRLLRGNLAVALISGSEDRMAAYAKAQFRSKRDNKLPFLSSSSPFRNRFFYDISSGMLEKDFPDPIPMHTEYFEYGIQNNLLDP